MRGLKQCVTTVLCAAGLTSPLRASAQSAAPIELKWNALEGCPSADTVLARVHKIAGSTRPTPNTLRADASITQPNEGLFRLRLQIEYGNLVAVRTIEGKSCKDLAGATAVALALLLSSEEPLSERDLAGTSPKTGAPPGREQERTEQASPQSQSTTVQASVPTTSPSPRVEAEPARRWHLLFVAPLGALSAGPTPQVSLGLGLVAGLSFDRWLFLAEGKLWASQRETVSSFSDEYQVELDRLTVGARGCRGLFGARLELAPCVLMSVHRLSVRGSGPNLVSRTETTAWAAVGVGAQARFLVTPWLGLVAGIDGELQLAWPEVEISLPAAGSAVPSATSVQRLAPVAATVTVGSQWIF